MVSDVQPSIHSEFLPNAYNVLTLKFSSSDVRTGVPSGSSQKLAFCDEYKKKSSQKVRFFVTNVKKVTKNQPFVTIRIGEAVLEYSFKKMQQHLPELSKTKQFK